MMWSTSDKAVSTLRVFMAGRDRWEGTATNLLEALVAFVKQPLRDAEAELEAAIFDSTAQSRAEAKLREAREKVRETLGKGWPGNPRALSGRLKKAGPALRQIGVAIEWPTRHGDARIITITSSSVRPLQICVPIVPCVPSRHAVADHSKSKQRLARRRERRAGRKRDAGGTQEGRNVEAFASHDKRLNGLPNTPGFGAGDKWDANSADLSSLQEPRDASEGNAAQAESNVNFKSSPAREEGRASDSDGSTASGREAENRRTWRLRL